MMALNYLYTPHTQKKGGCVEIMYVFKVKYAYYAILFQMRLTH